MQELAIPDGPEAITPAWLTAALRSSGALKDAVVTAVTWQPLSTQGWTTRLARLAVTYDVPAAGLPATLVVKAAAQDAHTRVSFGRFYAHEVAFYQRVAPEVPLRVPRCYYAAYGAATHAHVLLLEDLAPVLGLTTSCGASVSTWLRRIHATLPPCMRTGGSTPGSRT